MNLVFPFMNIMLDPRKPHEGYRKRKIQLSVVDMTDTTSDYCPIDIKNLPKKSNCWSEAPGEIG